MKPKETPVWAVLAAVAIALIVGWHYGSQQNIKYQKLTPVVKCLDNIQEGINLEGISWGLRILNPAKYAIRDPESITDYDLLELKSSIEYQFGEIKSDLGICRDELNQHLPPEY